MDTQNIKAFLEVAAAGSFSAAAASLHITQPAVSKRIALLEQQLECRLFDRIGRRVSLTEAGRALHPHAEAVYRELDAARQSVADLSGQAAGRLRLATSHHVGLHRLPPVLSAFSRDYPQVQLDIDFMDSERAYDKVLQGDFELAVITLAPQADASVFARELWPDPLDFMAAADHPLVAQGCRDLTDLERYPAILPGLNTYTGQIVKRLFDRQKLKLEISMSTNYLETIRMMATVGLGWTVLPRSMRDDTLRSLDLRGGDLSRRLGYIHHRGRSLSNAAKAFINCLATSD